MGFSIKAVIKNDRFTMVGPYGEEDPLSASNEFQFYRVGKSLKFTFDPTVTPISLTVKTYDASFHFKKVLPKNTE